MNQSRGAFPFPAAPSIRVPQPAPHTAPQIRPTPCTPLTLRTPPFLEPHPHTAPPLAPRTAPKFTPPPFLESPPSSHLPNLQPVRRIT